MPQISERQQILNEVEQCMKFAIMHQVALEDEQETDGEDVPFLSDDEDDLGYEALANIHQGILASRYLNPGKRIAKSRDYVLNYFLNQSDLNFRKITHVSHEKFHQIISLIENHPVFQNASTCPQAPVHWQLACALDRLGNDGQGVSHARSKLIWGIGQGTVHLYTRRVIKALCSLKEDFIGWPTSEERVQIRRRLERKGFKLAIGFVDGTTIPVHKKPAVHGNTFMDRKKRYSVNAQIVCDDNHNIIFFLTGDPGGVHDARAFSSSILQLRPDLAFSEGEYLLADSAYGASLTIVPAYKGNQVDDRQDREEARKIERFNTYLAKAHVVNEHTIGIFKGRWTSMRGMRVDIHKPEDMRNVVMQATACEVLHNLCNQSDPWDEEFSDVAEEEDEDPGADVIRQGRTLTIGQRKHWEVRNACLAYHDR